MSGSARAVAAIDCGTNSIRLLVRRGTDDLERRATITRLGADLDRTGRLDGAAIERTIAVLEQYRRLCDDLGVERLRAVATSAARDAANRDEFLERAGDALGVAPELLSGWEEGTLAFRGAVEGLEPECGPFCVIDLGGGSTEFALGGEELEAVCSVDMGSVRFTERYLRGDPPLAEELAACISVVQAHIADVRRAVPGIGEARTFIGVAGTITTIAAVELGMAAYRPELIHGLELTKEAAEDVYRTLVTEPLALRRLNPGLAPERAEVIVGGATVLVATMRELGIDPLVVSEHDLLDGIAADLSE